MFLSRKHPNLLLIVAISVLLVSCGKKQKEPLRIGLNPWPGYQLINLAHELKLFEEYDVDVEIVDLMSNGEVNRIYELGYIDIAGSTLTDLVKIRINSENEPAVFYICDYSNGADVIISKNNRSELSDLKGKRIGADVGALDYIHLLSALEYYDMEVDDVQVVPMRQTAMIQAMSKGKIDAAVTYPPVSNQLLQNDPELHSIFDTSKIPGVIIDVLVAEPETLTEREEEIIRFTGALKAAHQHFLRNRKPSIEIMAHYAGLSTKEFEEALSGIAMIEPEKQILLLEGGTLLPATIRKAFDLYNLDPDFAKLKSMFTPSILQKLEE
ncbi:MAG: ABC transporter substrate-binding protein [Verrucomicrobiota bacterium]